MRKKVIQYTVVLVFFIIIFLVYTPKSNSETNKLFPEFSVNNISDLDGKKFVITNLNSKYKAALTNESNENGIIANKDINLYELSGSIVGNSFDTWLFNKVSELGVNSEIYQISNSEGKYININGTKVELTEEPAYVWIRKSPVKNGQIVISDIEGVYFLDWYGANGRDTSFQAWNSTDLRNVNESFSLYIDSGETIESKTFFYERLKVDDVDELDGKKCVIAVNQNEYRSALAHETNKNELASQILISKNHDGDKLQYTGYSDINCIWTFEKINSGNYYIKVDIEGVTKYLSINSSGGASIAPITIGTVPCEFEVNIIEENIFNISNVNGKKYYINLSGTTKNFIGYEEADNNSKVMLYEHVDQFSRTAKLRYEITSGLREYRVTDFTKLDNIPEIESEEQLINNSSQLLEIINTDDEGGFIYYHTLPYSMKNNVRENDYDFFKDNSEGASHKWAKRYMFSHWEAVDMNGVTHKYGKNANVTVNSEGMLEIEDLDGNMTLLYDNTLLKAKYTIQSDTICFFINYEGTVIDIVGDIESRSEANYTAAVAIGHIYNVDALYIGSEDIFGKEASQLITSKFRSHYDKNDKDVQIVIEGLMKVTKDKKRLVEYEVLTGATDYELRNHTINYLKEYDIPVYLNSDKQIKTQISPNYLSTEDYDIRWYIAKNQNDTWHLDGVLAAHSSEIQVTKTVYGLSEEEEIQLMNNFNFELTIKDSSSNLSNMYTNNDTSDDHYNYNGKIGNTYNWSINSINNIDYRIEEKDYSFEGYNCLTTVTVNYLNGETEIFKNMSDFIGKDINNNAVLSVCFENYYTPVDTSILVVKKTSKNDNIPLEGVEFTLEKNDGSSTYTEVSSNVGSVVFNGLTSGKYILKETKALEGFYKINDEWEIDVSTFGEGTAENPYYYQTRYNDQILYSSSDKTINKLEIENELENNTLVVEKKFEGIEVSKVLDLNNYAIIVKHEGIDYTLKITDDNVQHSADGLTYYWILEYLPYGDYEIKEINYYIEPYEKVKVEAFKDDEKLEITEEEKGIAKFNVTLQKDENSKITIVNNYSSKAGLRIIKVDKEDNSKRLEGARFKIYGDFEEATCCDDSIVMDGKTYYYIKDTEKTNSDGEIYIEKLLNTDKEYIIVESEAPVGYTLNENRFVITVEDMANRISNGVFVLQVEDVVIQNEDQNEKQDGKSNKGSDEKKSIIDIFPLTGGSGLMLFELVGALLIIIALRTKNKKRKKTKRSHGKRFKN